jgi:hydrogenase maturation protease
MNLLVIGYGNELRGDDGVGAWVARAVAARQWPGVRALAIHQLLPELAEALSEAEQAVFVDARLGAEGTVELRPLVAEAMVGASGHTWGPQGLLAAARALYGRAPTAWLLTVPAQNLEHGESLSAAAERGAAEAVRHIASLVGD